MAEQGRTAPTPMTQEPLSHLICSLYVHSQCLRKHTGTPETK